MTIMYAFYAVGIIALAILAYRKTRKPKSPPKPKLPNTFGYNFNVEDYMKRQLEDIKLPMNWVWGIKIEQEPVPKDTYYLDVWIENTPKRDMTTMTIRPVNIVTGEKYKEAVTTDLNKLESYTLAYHKDSYPSLHVDAVKSKFKDIIQKCRYLSNAMSAPEGFSFTVVPKEMSE